jgi:hypothetical protein
MSMINKAERANALLGDEFFVELVENQKVLYKNNIFNSDENDVEFREKSLIKLRAIEEFEASIQAIADGMQIEAKKWKIF